MSTPSASVQLFPKLKLFIAANSEFSHLLCALPALQLELDANSLYVSFTHPYFASFFNQHLRNDFEIACCRCAERQLDFRYSQARPSLPATGCHVHGHTLNPFDSFIPNSRNMAALECAKNLSAFSGSGLQLAIFHGAPGSGKSHLLSVIAAACQNSCSHCDVINCRAESFATPLPPEHFWQTTHALVLDDLQDVAGQASLQKLLSVLIDCARQSDLPAKIVFSLPSRDTRIFNARFGHRLEQGLFIELFPADFSLRLAYAEKKARDFQLSLSKSQLLAIARHQRGISAITGILQKFKFYASLQDRLPDTEMVEKLAMPESSEPAWQQSLLRVAAKMGVKPSEIIGKSKRQEFVIARQAAMYICRLKFGLSYPELGRIFGGRDHATVMHGIKKIQQLRQSDKVLHSLLTELEQEEEP